MAGPPHQRLAAELGDAVEQHLAGLDVGDHRGAGMLRQDLGGVDGDQLVAPQHTPLLVDHADAVAVAVEGAAEIGLRLGDSRPPALPRFRHRWVSLEEALVWKECVSRFLYRWAAH